MKSFLTDFRIPFFILLIAASLFSFNGSFEFSGDRDADAIESEIFLLNNPVVSPYSDSKTSDLNTLVQHDRPVIFNSPFTAADTSILPANPGPANNGLSAAGSGILFNLIGRTRDVLVTRVKTALSLAAGAPVRFEVYIRDGNALGGPVGSGPGSSLAGWTLIDTADGFQGSTTNGISELITLGPIPVAANDTVGVAFKFLIGGPRYFGTGSGPYTTYSDTNIALVTGDARSTIFLPSGSFFAPRELTGEIRYVVSTTTGITNLNTGVPQGYSLSQNYPNPFNPETNIQFAIPEKNNVTLKVFNVQGKEVAVLANGEYAAGTYMVNWNAADLSSGVYFYTIQTGSFTQTKKLLLVK